MSKRRMETMDGNTAAAYVSYGFTEVAGIFPITPSSPMAELIDEWAAHGKKNFFGQPVRVIEMQSEGGASAVVHGALQGGAYATTYTASQGLLLMIPSMYRTAGELLPAVFHVAARSLANNAWSIFGEHQDVMAVRQTGFAILASSSVQDAMNLGAVAHLCAIRSRVPFLHFMDGFRTSHEIQKIEVLEDEELRALVDWDAVKHFRDNALNPDHPELRGSTVNPDVFFQLRESVNPWYRALPETIDHYMGEINRLTGRDYGFFNYHGAPDAERVVISMGSSCTALTEVVDWLSARGEKVGLVTVHVFRPFVPERLLKVIPSTVKKIAVLDRTKENAAAGEPLYQDVRSAFCGHAGAPVVVGGRYGIGSKDFNPSMAFAVFENLKQSAPKNSFTVGIVDDVCDTSLPRPSEVVDTAAEGTIACKFWGLGSDGTVGANKSAIKIIGNHTDMYAQAYFAYDSKKSGGVTISHLRFGRSPILSSYYIDRADFIACHNEAYVGLYDLLEGLKRGGKFLLNCSWSAAELEERLPAAMKRFIAENEVEFYTVDAVKIAQELGLGGRINMIMQAAFFRLAHILPVEEAVKYLKDAVVDSYGKQGQKVVDMNHAAIDRGVSDVKLFSVPPTWKNAQDSAPEEKPKRGFFVDVIMDSVLRQKGDDLPVSTFKGYESGFFPLGTTRWEKRGIAVRVPVWKSENCLQCNQCAFICPHAVLRPLLADENELKGAPADLQTLPATGFEGKKFHLAISSLDCTGCGGCVEACPAKNKALVMKPLNEVRDTAAPLWDFADSHISCKELPEKQTQSVKGSQFVRPLLEFSGACAGCGETPYVKLLTQLFGDRMVVVNTAGCSAVWGGSFPSMAYRKNDRGHGPAYGYSLFEDCGEYGFGIHMGATQNRERLAGEVREALTLGNLSQDLKTAMTDWLDLRLEVEGTRARADRLSELLEKEKGSDEALNRIWERRDFLVKRSLWIVGGDGWAYDIGYGGLDHVLAAGEDVNVLVLDTEVYSNTGGQSSKATPTAAVAGFNAGGKRTGKKDLGLMAVTYGNIYVGQTAMGADKSHTLKTFLEADRYPGTSLVIAYCPCINHGLVAGMGKSQEQERRAVEAGYWSLYRHNPQLRQAGKNPFSLDSKKPTASFRDFLLSEVRYAALQRQFPEVAEALFQKSEEEAKARYASYQRLAGEDKIPLTAQ
ncbi:MAG: pyruvate:ferredoxin (flavodoxin) oxidoreductase [Synergistaceae bacterium]|nr:pyruvate:ferredoxin (flavodoxin) oxidoreductase [Synergistaceae bacterium]